MLYHADLAGQRLQVSQRAFWLGQIVYLVLYL